MLQLDLDLFHSILGFSQLLGLGLQYALLVRQQSLGLDLKVNGAVSNPSVLLGLIGILFVDVCEDLVLFRLVLCRGLTLSLSNFFEATGKFAFSLLQLDLLFVQSSLSGSQSLLSCKNFILTTLELSLLFS